MLHPSYTDLMKIVNEDAEGDTPVVNSRYTIVMATAKRARQIIAESENQPELAYDRQKIKPLSQAVKELSEGSLRIIPEEDPENDAPAVIAEAAASEQDLSAQSEEESVSEEV